MARKVGCESVGQAGEPAFTVSAPFARVSLHPQPFDGSPRHEAPNVSLDQHGAFRAVDLAALRRERAFLIRFATAARARLCTALALAEGLPALQAVAVEDMRAR